MTQSLDDTLAAESDESQSLGLATEPVAPSEHAAVAEPGQKLGRYLVLSRLGAGAMGVVLAAYDPELDRKVAIKLLRPRGHDDTGAHARLLREGQALAKLSHPNVVAVHDVGVHGGQVFVAMEFVDGQTLGAWIAAASQPRPWREVARVFELAGRGLAAAHARGLVHRDFKPDNVMIDDEGRVRVMDFGLVRAQLEREPAPTTDGESSAAPLRGSLTQTGAIMGTPAYMAPEQFSRAEVTAAADQFSFCVALHEALYGQRPFVGDNVGALVAAVTQGQPREPPRGTAVPSWLRRLVRRGLSTDPRDRFPTMAMLVDELARAESRVRQRRWLGGVGVLAVIVGGAAGVRAWGIERETRACTAEGDAIGEVWNDTRRAELRAAIDATGVRDASATADALMPWIDDHAEAWRTHATAACLHARVEHDWPPEQLDKARWCLQERRIQLASIVGGLAGVRAEEVPRVVQLAAELQPPVTCVDPAVLHGMPPLPAEVADDELAAVRGQLADADLARMRGDYGEGRRQVAEAKTRAEALGWAPLVAQASVQEASLLTFEGAYAEAETLALDAYLDAVRSSAWSVAAAGAGQLIYALGLQARHAEAEVWARHAEVMAELAGDPLGLRAAAIADARGTVRFWAGDYERAQASYEDSLARWTEALGRLHPTVATAENNLANALMQRGDLDGALAGHRRALEIRRAVLGPLHPDIGSSLNNLGSVLRAQGQLEPAQALHEEGLALWTEGLGPKHPDVATALNNLGMVHMARRDAATALPLFERALAIWETTLGPKHPNVAAAVHHLASIHRELGRLDEAAGFARRATEIFEATLGPTHLNLAASLVLLGQIERARGHLDDARTSLERGLAILEPAGDPEETARARESLAEVVRAQASDAGTEPRAQPDAPSAPVPAAP